MNRVKVLSLPCLLVTLLAALLLQTGGAQAAGLQCSWSITNSRNRSPYDNALNGVAPVSSNNAWSVGSYNSKPLGPGRTLIEQWNGRKWISIPSPNVGPYNNSLNGVVALAANNTWAAGYYTQSTGITQTLVEHWDGTNWSVVTSPNVGSSSNTLNGIVAISPGSIWAVGSYTNQQNMQATLIEHWNGSNWSVVASPNPGSVSNALYAVAAVSANNLWAVGDFVKRTGGNPQTLVEHWNGSNWSAVHSPNPGSRSNVLNGVTAVSARDLWAVGTLSNGTNDNEALTERWDGMQWSVIPNPNLGTFAFLYGVTAVSASNVWAVGTYYNNINGDQEALIEQWDGTQWSFVNSPLPEFNGVFLVSVAQTPGTAQLWAVGNYYDVGGVDRTLAEDYC